LLWQKIKIKEGMSLQESTKELDVMAEGLKGIDKETGKAPKERMLRPAALRSIHDKNITDDEVGSYNRSLVQADMDFAPPFDEKELAEKGQGDRFNFNTGEAAAIKNEAVSGYVDIYSTPTTIAEIPLKNIEEPMKSLYEKIMAEEFTSMDRAHDSSFPTFLQLCDLYVTHGVAIGYFEDKQTMHFKVGGLDRFKFPRKTTIITSDLTLCTCDSTMSVIDLYQKISGDTPLKGWNKDAVIKAIVNAASQKATRWNEWEKVQEDIKSNDVYLESQVDVIELVYGWVVEFDKSVSFYITTKNGHLPGTTEAEEEFLFKEVSYYKSVQEAFQIFAFTIGNNARIHSVRGLGYLIYQICNAMNVLTCKMMDNARVEGSMLFQAGTQEDLEDLEIIDFGGGIALPPSLSIPARGQAANLNNSMVPAINLGRGLLDRATGGLSAGNMILANQQDRRTKLEVSAQLDWINKLNSFAINLFYGPLDHLMREKVKRAFTVRQPDQKSREMVESMKERCRLRGVPDIVFDQIDYEKVKAQRIIGTGSRVSRVMIYDQLQQMYASMDEIGRKNFTFDVASELIGADKTTRYFGRTEEQRLPMDAKIAELENTQLLQGQQVAPMDGEMHIVHIPRHLAALEEGLQGVENGQVDLMEYAVSRSPLHEHLIQTLQITTVQPEIQEEYNSYVQRAQQIGEIIVNGIRAYNKQQQQAEEEAAQQAAQGQPQGQGEPTTDPVKAQEARMKLQMQAEIHQEKLRQMKELGQQKIVLETQKAMSQIAAKDAETQARIERARALG
jgi:hypothetical protein